MIRIASALVLCAALSGCAARYDAPNFATGTCPDEPRLAADVSTDREMIGWFERVRMAGAECRRKYRSLVDRIEEYQD